jgi:3-hydroxybutyryl-CoA dehydrogenase
MTTYTRVAVVGFGAMGAGIAQVCAQAELEVTILDTDEARLAHGRWRLQEFLAGGVARGKLTAEQRDAVVGRISATTDLAQLAGADIVIEAIVEDAAVKRETLLTVAETVGPDTPIVTNTSALSVTDLAAAVPHPHRFAGLHFFNPAPVMRLVEVVRALQTDDATVAAVLDFARVVDKVAVEVKDRPGFLVNRLLMPYLNDVVQAYDDGLASARDIDVAIELGLGHPRGPLGLLDLIGLDVHEHATTNAYEATFDPQFAPPPLLGRMVAAGYHGQKTGRGFRAGIEEA